MGTVTLNLSDDVEEFFRKKAKERFGKGKGCLKQAIEEAITIWNRTTDSDEATQRVLQMMEKGLPIGYKPYKVRDELHDRSI